jgi:hypothetical protein
MRSLQQHCRFSVIAGMQSALLLFFVTSSLVADESGRSFFPEAVNFCDNALWECSGSDMSVGVPDEAVRQASATLACDLEPACDSYGGQFGVENNPLGPSFKLTEFNIYPTFSYLDDLSATYNEFEFASITELGWFEIENRTVLNVADLPSTISLGPTNPGESPTKVGVRAQGFGDILSGFFFSTRGSHERRTHLGIGPVLTFPTASDAILGSEQYTAGPGAHFSTEIGRLTTGFFVWQSWGFGGSSTVKRVDQLFGKPFMLYELNEKWEAIYIPLGLSHSWNAPSGDDWTVPIGGGLRRLVEIHGQQMGLQFQAFDYVARKPKDPEWELRATIEFLYD